LIEPSLRVTALKPWSACEVKLFFKNNENQQLHSHVKRIQATFVLPHTDQVAIIAQRSS